jgi:hypothetical protein
VWVQHTTLGRRGGGGHLAEIKKVRPLVLDFDPPTPLIVKPWWGIDEELKVAGVRRAQIEE